MIARRVEKASVDRFGANAGVGKRGFEWVLAGGQRHNGPSNFTYQIRYSDLDIKKEGDANFNG